MSDKKVVSLSEVLKRKQDKEKELEMYRRHLSMIEDRMGLPRDGSKSYDGNHRDDRERCRRSR